MSHPTESESDCPFCAIATAFPPISPSQACYPPSPDPPSSTITPSAASSTSRSSHPSPTSSGDPLDPERTLPPSYVILSAPDVVAFLDIAPLTRGHVLIATRRHRVKSGDLKSGEAAEVCLLFYHLSTFQSHGLCVVHRWDELVLLIHPFIHTHTLSLSLAKA